MALAIAMSGTGIVTIAAPLVLGPLIAAQGWRAGYLAMGLFEVVAAELFFVLLAPTRAAPREHLAPAGSAEAVGMTLRQAAGTRRFWLLAALFLLMQASA